jgi:hypothetical protein
MRTFNKKWKRRKDYTKFWYKFSIFIAIHLGLYKKEYYSDDKWHFKTYTFLLQNKYDCLDIYFNTGTMEECKVQFKNALKEEISKCPLVVLCT